MSTSPTYEQVRALPCTFERPVPAAYLDANEHLNIASYMELYSRGAWDYMARHGLGEDAARAGVGSMAVSHFIRYLREVHVDDVIACHVRLFEREGKALHLMYFLAYETRREVASSLEALNLSVDLDTRRVGAFPDDVAGRLDAQVRTDSEQGWAAPTCGAITIRR